MQGYICDVQPMISVLWLKIKRKEKKGKRNASDLLDGRKYENKT